MIVHEDFSLDVSLRTFVKKKKQIEMIKLQAYYNSVNYS